MKISLSILAVVALATNSSNAFSPNGMKAPTTGALSMSAATEEEVTHIICMPNVTKEQIDAFVKDVENCVGYEEEEVAFSF